MAAQLVHRRIGLTGVSVPNIAFGMAPIGNMPATYGHGIDDEHARAVVRAVFDSPINCLDVSRNYGLGRAEARIGEVIKERGGPPKDFIIATKLDRDNDTNRFDGDQARRSLEASLRALNLDKVQILHLHDPEYAADIAAVNGTGGAAETLFKLKEEGLADAVGLAAGRVDVMAPLIDQFDFDIVLSHSRYTLVNRNADALINQARARGMTVFNAAPYASGVLAKGSRAGARYVYQEATEAMLAPVRAMEAVASRYDVPLGALALQFSLRDPRITSTILGTGKVEHIQKTLDWAAIDIPEAAFADVDGIEVTRDDPEATRQYSNDSLG